MAHKPSTSKAPKQIDAFTHGEDMLLSHASWSPSLWRSS